MKSPSVKICYFIGAILCFVGLGFALYLEYVDQLPPCPLCQLQRIVIGVMGVIFFTALFHSPTKLSAKIYGFIITFVGIIGMLLAGRQIYLQQTIPSHLQQECVPGLSYLFSIMPFGEALKTAIQGSGNCAKVMWQFLGLNIAEWSFIIFVVLILLSLWQIKNVK